jgi:hypothetical protein
MFGQQGITMNRNMLDDNAMRLSLIYIIDGEKGVAMRPNRE